MVQRGAARWIGQGAVLLVLVVLRLAWPLLLVAGLFVAPSIWSLRGELGDEPGQHSAPWWWAAMMVAALGARVLVTAA